MPPTIFVLFGATGDLARRMVLPAFAALAVNDLMPEQWVLIGNGRKDQDDAWFADQDVMLHWDGTALSGMTGLPFTVLPAGVWSSGPGRVWVVGDHGDIVHN